MKSPSGGSGDYELSLPLENAFDTNHHVPDDADLLSDSWAPYAWVLC